MKVELQAEFKFSKPITKEADKEIPGRHKQECLQERRKRRIRTGNIKLPHTQRLLHEQVPHKRKAQQRNLDRMHRNRAKQMGIPFLTTPRNGLLQMAC